MKYNIMNKVNVLSTKIYILNLRYYISLGSFVTSKSNNSIICQLLEIKNNDTNRSKEEVKVRLHK